MHVLVFGYFTKAVDPLYIQTYFWVCLYVHKRIPTASLPFFASWCFMYEIQLLSTMNPKLWQRKGSFCSICHIQAMTFTLGLERFFPKDQTKFISTLQDSHIHFIHHARSQWLCARRASMCPPQTLVFYVFLVNWASLLIQHWCSFDLQ